MKARFGFIDPGAIMGVVVALIILGVGVFSFFVVTKNLADQSPVPSDGNWSNMTAQDRRIRSALNNTTGTGDSVFNIVGIILLIGAIMSIVGLVYNYVR